jgi:dTDP-4-amino-4,6-dideoxygalactose transaminase
VSTRSTFLPFALPDTDQSEIDQIAEAVRSGWVTTGPKTRQFETEFAAAVGAKYAVAVNSCTAAMHLALEAVGLGREAASTLPSVAGQALRHSSGQASTLPSVAGQALRHSSGQALVLTTPYTFAATAEVVRYFDAVPVFVDVEPDTLNIDPDLLAEAVEALTNDERRRTKDAWLPPSLRGGRRSAVGGRLKALLPVHVAGLPADLDAIYAIAAEYGLAVVEDAAHAFPAQYKGRTIGGRSSVTSRQSPDGHASRIPVLSKAEGTHPCPEPGRRDASLVTPQNPELRTQSSRLKTLSAVCFSFYATKPITTGEGGMLCTEDPALAERCRVMALHGISQDAWKRYTAAGSWYYEIVAPGYKYNMTDIAAAMGLAQLRKADRMWRRRRQIAEAYNQAFGSIPELQIPADRADCQHAWHLYVLRLNLEELTISRDQFIQELKARNIGASVHFIPLHLHPYYRETYGYRPSDFPVATREYQRAVSLPIYSRMSDADIEDVVGAVVGIVRAYRKKGVFVEVGGGSKE